MARRHANQRMKGWMTVTSPAPIGLPMPGQSLAREAGKARATSPAQTPVAVPAKTAGLSVRSRTALPRPPRGQQDHAWK